MTLIRGALRSVPVWHSSASDGAWNFQLEL